MSVYSFGGALPPVPPPSATCLSEILLVSCSLVPSTSAHQSRDVPMGGVEASRSPMPMKLQKVLVMKQGL